MTGGEILLGVAALLIGSDGILIAVLKHKWEKEEKGNDYLGKIDNLKAKQDEHSKAITKLEQAQQLIVSTLSMVSYSTLSSKLYHYTEKGYADEQDRKEISLIYDVYKAHGWNGDMENRIEKFYALPYSKDKKE